MRISDWSSDVCSSDLQKQAGDLDEVLEERDVAHQVGDGFEQRPSGVEPGLGDAARPHEIGRGEAGAAGLAAAPGEALEDNLRAAVPVADDVGEDADEHGLLDQPRDDVVVGDTSPEQIHERHTYY